MKGFKCDIETLSLENRHFEKVLYTGKFLQLEIFSLKIGEELGLDTREENDRFFRFESGIGKCIVGANVFEVEAGEAVLVSAGCKCNVINVSDEHHLLFYALNSPPYRLNDLDREIDTDADR